MKLTLAAERIGESSLFALVDYYRHAIDMSGEKYSVRRGCRLGDGHIVHHCRSTDIFCQPIARSHRAARYGSWYRSGDPRKREAIYPHRPHNRSRHLHAYCPSEHSTPNSVVRTLSQAALSTCPVCALLRSLRGCGQPIWMTSGLPPNRVCGFPQCRS